MTGDILRRMKFSNDDHRRHAWKPCCSHMKFMHVQEMRTARLKRWMAHPTFDDQMALHRVDCLGCHGMLDNYEFLQAKQQEFANEPVIPPPLLNGPRPDGRRLPAGPEIGRLLTAVQDQQLEGTLTTQRSRAGVVACGSPASRRPSRGLIRGVAVYV